ncbi:Putative phosphatidylinositol kinase related prot ein [Trichuris trichiura]|uniref:Putative phosphatidylinositol kinase related prot ein n=1 Tax=Trichuris trichiura TaxID=36087 RepID=A0A077ZFN9_TRITR|nr:Putative phosphatidylinositol kinase related prot ein [Trichuris trichiura]
MAILVYGSGSGSKCPHDLFADLKGWYLESLNKLQASSSTADDKQIGKKFAAPLGCITLMNRRTVSSKADILEGADEACRQLPNGRIYGDVDVAGLKVEGSRILIGIKIVKLESKSSTTNNILTGAAVVYPDMREITFSFERKDSGEINEVGVVLRIKRSMVETLFNNPSTPVCIIRVEESTEITSCTLFNSYTSMLCQSSALLNCSRGADTFDKGCTCKEGFTGALCLERGEQVSSI